MGNPDKKAAPPIAAGKRENSRLRVSLPATMLSATADEPCELLDLSATGARFLASEPPKPGAMVLVRCLHLELFGTVVWRRKGVAGMEFDEPMPLNQVVSLRDRAEEVAYAQKEEVRRAAKVWARGHGS